MKCLTCNFETSNKKSMSNHLRYGCQFQELGYYPDFKERKKIDEIKRWKKYNERYHQKQKDYLSSEKGRAMMKRRNGKFAKLHKDRVSVYRKVGYAIKTGKLERENCLYCEKLGEAHHRDYKDPLNVVWLCRKHHRIEEGVWKGNYATG